MRRPPTERLRRRPALSAAATGAVLGVASLAVGCGGPRADGPSLFSRDPVRRIPAMKQVVRGGDVQPDEARALVKSLVSDDPAVRLYAIGALERLTGETFGYRYYDGPAKREPAVKRWRQWLEDRTNAGATAADNEQPE